MPLHYVAWKEVIRDRGYDYPEDLFYELAGIPTKKIVPIINSRLGYNLDPHSTVEEKEAIFLSLLHQTKPIEPVVRLVLSGAGKMPMALGTGGRRDIAKRTIEAIGLDAYFDILVAAEDVINHKPFPDTFLKCAELMNVPPRFCQVFEDGDKGLEAAREAGMIATDVRPFLG